MVEEGRFDFYDKMLVFYEKTHFRRIGHIL